MIHIQSIQELTLQNSWVTIGSFDGVHLGHQALLHNFITEAHAAGCQAVVIIIFPHPIKVLHGKIGPYYISTPEERAEIMEKLGVDQVIILEFSRSLADTPADQFVDQMVGHLGMKMLWAGFNFALGKGRTGDIPALQKLGDSRGFLVKVFEPTLIQGDVVSSTMVRELITMGEMEKVTACLGRYYRVVGQVIHGDGRGRQIGIPTANLAIWPERLLPALGVHAGWSILDNGERHPSVSNVGIRPTFESEPKIPRLEVMLLDFDRNIYGQTMYFDFVSHLRGEQRYESVEKLIDQIRQDTLKAREILNHDSGSPGLSIRP